MAIVTTILLGLTLFHIGDSAQVQQYDDSTPAFTAELYSNVIKNAIDQNVIISPTSIHTALGLAYFGAKGRTANELQSALRLSGNDRNDVANKYRNLLESAEQSQQLHIANRMFVSTDFTVNPGFNDVAFKSFKSEAQNLNFKNQNEAANTMNNWVEKETQNKIKNLFQANSIQADDAMYIVNAIYFKGEWAIPFTSQTTRPDNFYNFGTNPVKVNLMWNDDRFKYGEFKELDATAIEMDYKNSDYSMLILLPNNPQGLNNLEEKLKTLNILRLSERMKPENVDVLLPKFEIEFEKSLVEDLKNMGMQAMFSNRDADFGNLFVPGTRYVKVDEVFHKAYINVNEAGSEAGASTYLKIVPLSLNLNQKYFKVDHPFVFVIKDKSNVYFIGHIVKF